MSELHLHNTLTRAIERFEPLEPGHVRIYSCGPTVYNFVHIGNLRTFLWNDLLRRYLEWKGYRVTHVMNFTDVDDRIIRHAAGKGVDLDSYTAPYIEAFYRDIDTLRISRAHLYPRATRHIDEMVALVQRLGEAGHTYLADGSTYFRIATFVEYGKLSKVEVTEASTFSRLDSDEDDKQDARDFVLWKGKKEGEPSWPAPIGEGRPGWHLECSAMSMKYLGETFDIHTGAVDLIFPHHENEIAQSEGATGRPFVKYWVHGEHLIVEERKMSKSLGNVFTLPELLEEGFSPLQIRYALLAVPYRTRLNFTFRSLDDAKHSLERLELFMMRLDELAHGEAVGEAGRSGALVEDLLAGFESAMDDDMNTAAALGALFTFIRDANIAIDEGAITAGDAGEMRAAVAKIDRVFDILPKRDVALDEEIEELIAARNEARKKKNFAESDRLRDLLLSRGIILEDTPAGTRWRRK
ncbi:MAG TPA: cysteine--tRNA ligase [Thermoanaerobaculia bacterium]|nr:cysteine--tRNA ligase [Thermoanaerobaculia bacterium]